MTGSTHQPCEPIQAAVARYEAAAAEVDRFHEEEHSPALKACAAAIAAVPHVTTKRSFVNVKGEAKTLCTINTPVLAAARSILASPPVSHDPVDWLAALRELVGLADARDVKITDLRRQFKVDDLRAREVALGEEAYVAMFAVIETPARDLADVLFKIEFINENGVAGEETVLDSIAEDLRRFVRSGGPA